MRKAARGAARRTGVAKIVEAFGEQNLPRIEARELAHQRRSIAERGRRELARRQIEPGQANRTALQAIDRAQVVVRRARRAARRR